MSEFNVYEVLDGEFNEGFVILGPFGTYGQAEKLLNESDISGNIATGVRSKILCPEIDRLKQENEKLKACIEFYARKDIYRELIPQHNNEIYEIIGDEEFVKGSGWIAGKLARQTLKELKTTGDSN